jgi:hypothetical protein
MIKINALREMIASAPDSFPQRRHYSLHGEYRRVGMLKYALGYPLPEVAEALTLALCSYEHVLSRRGTEERFQAHIALNDAAHPDHGKLKPAFPTGRDFSMGNSQETYYGICLSLAIGQTETAVRMAAYCWDPPGASYVGPGSFCTANDQRLAYSARKFYEGDHEGALKSVKAIRPAKGESNDVVSQATIWEGILKPNVQLFLGGLSRLLDWHRAQVGRDTTWWLRKLVCIEGVGLARLAVQRGIIGVDRLPNADVLLPLDLSKS